VKKNERSPRKATLKRRAKILDAALRSFTRHGAAATTIADVRKASKTSIGSIYHQFSGKEELHAALYVDTLRVYQEALLTRVCRARGAERRVRVLVEAHLDWVARERVRARFLFTAERPPAASPAGRDLSQLNRRFFDRLFESLEEMHAGALRTLPRDLFLAIALGPAESYVRDWLDGRSRTPLTRAKRALADSAWAAVRKGR
jgi:AcrR family transcriptional regulator